LRRLLPPETPNGRGVADAWAACCDDEAPEPESIGVLVISGDEAAANPNVRALAAQAEATIVISMFELEDGWSPDLLLPGTSYLERDGTFVNLEGRLQRLRRTATPPCPDELEWIAELAARFDVDIAPYATRSSPRSPRRSTAGLRSARSASARRCVAIPTRRRASTCRCSPNAT
jgi:anaerobic selenocysteine-containing dehydrogenase